MHSDAEHKVEEVGCQRLKPVPVPELSAGKVGYVLAGTSAAFNPTASPLGPMVISTTARRPRGDP
jgi:translation elongation factor EF-4